MGFVLQKIDLANLLEMLLVVSQHHIYLQICHYITHQVTMTLTWSYLDMAKRAGRVRFRLGQLGYGSGRVDPYFSNELFFFFNYKNKSMTTFLERMNKINDNLFRKNE